MSAVSEEPLFPLDDATAKMPGENQQVGALPHSGFGNDRNASHGVATDLLWVDLTDTLEPALTEADELEQRGPLGTRPESPDPCALVVQPLEQGAQGVAVVQCPETEGPQVLWAGFLVGAPVLGVGQREAPGWPVLARRHGERPAVDIVEQ